MMNFLIKLHPNVEKFINKQNKDISERIRARLKLLETNPFRYLEHFEGDDCYKFRLGVYRALIDVDFERKIVFVRILDHRGRIYDQ